PDQRDPIHTALNILAYFGPALLGLALLAPFLASHLSPRILVFLLCGTFIPVAELLVLGRFNVVIVTWSYGFIRIVPCALLAGSSVAGAWERGARWLAGGLGVLAVVSCCLFLGAYHLWWDGDRPRWDEAAAYLRDEANVGIDERHNPRIFSNVPRVVAF